MVGIGPSGGHAGATRAFACELRAERAEARRFGTTAVRIVGKADEEEIMPRKCLAPFLLAVAVFAASPAAAQTVLFTGARLIPGDGSPATEDAAILVDGGVIARIGRASEVQAPAGATTIALS